LKLSVGILTYNSEKYLPQVLESVRGIADQIVVLDSGSTDRTCQIVEEFGGELHRRRLDNFVNQRNHLLSLCTGDWVLFIDSDEVVSPELAGELLKLKEGEPPFDGYYINVMTSYLGRWIKHAWYPDWHLRLARRDRCRWVGSEVHESLTVDGRVGRLEGNLLHYSYTSLSEHLKKIDLYTTLYARGAFRKGKRFSLLKLLTSPPGSFIRRYILKRGFLDGFEGFLLSVMASYYSFLKYAKLWEIEKKGESSRSS